jgi:serine/threonine protein kinase
MPDEVEGLYQMSSGLKFIHEKKMIHRDIKPKNILISVLDGSARLKIADLGFTKRLKEDGIHYDLASGLKGTEYYMASELLALKNSTGRVLDTELRSVQLRVMFSPLDALSFATSTEVCILSAKASTLKLTLWKGIQSMQQVRTTIRSTNSIRIHEAIAKFYMLIYILNVHNLQNMRVNRGKLISSQKWLSSTPKNDHLSQMFLKY